MDEEITADLKWIADFASEHIAKRQRTEASQSSMYNTTPIYPPPLSGANAFTPNDRTSTYNPRGSTRGSFRGFNAQRPAKGRRLRCPKLLPIEYELLEKHNGCRKCQCFYVNHKLNNCPNDFPDPDTYVTLTEEMALQARSCTAVASTYNPNQLSQPPYAQQTSSSSFAEEVNNENNTHQSSVAAILPSSSATPFNLGNGGSDMESEPTSVSPISVPHYIWNANVYGNNDFPTPIPCLLDNGAHLVLIRPETVVDLGLKIRKLHKPESATVAINSQRHTFLLADYVTINLSSLNNAWTSRPVRALIAPDLCTSILLGLPFLKHNKIVIDHESDTAIDKISGFDLLNEVLFAHPSKKPLPLFHQNKKEKRY